METLLDWLNARTLAAAALLAAALYAGVAYQEQSRRWYQDWRDPRQSDKSPLASTIESDLESHSSLRLRALHREVSGEIARARAEGFAVEPLQESADAALALDTPVLRAVAFDRLQKLRLVIPRKSLKLRVARDDDDSAEAPPPRAKSARRARRHAR